jgi:hypothetical protein
MSSNEKIPVCQWATCPRNREVAEGQNWLSFQCSCVDRVYAEERKTYLCDPMHKLGRNGRTFITRVRTIEELIKAIEPFGADSPIPALDIKFHIDKTGAGSVEISSDTNDSQLTDCPYKKECIDRIYDASKKRFVCKGGRA